MSEKRIRKIPVVDDKGKLSGIIRLDDLIMLFGQEASIIASAIACGTSSTTGKRVPVR